MLRNDANRRIELRHAVIQNRILFGARVAIAFARDDVKKLRTAEVADVGERVDERIDIMSVDRTDVVEAEFLEERAGKHHALDVLLGALRDLVDGTELCEHLLAASAHGVVEP